MRLLTVLAVTLALAGVAQAQVTTVFKVEMQPSGGTPVSQAGFEIWAAAPSGTGAISFTTAGGQTITLTPSLASGPNGSTVSFTATDKKTDADYTDGAPREYAIQDYFRCQAVPWGIGNDTVIPRVSVEITGLVANTAYGCRIGNMNPYRNVWVEAQPTLGTTGVYTEHVALNPPALHATDPIDHSYQLSYTSDGVGQLHFDLTWDRAQWTQDPVNYPGQPEHEVEIAYMILQVPEPMTMSLLALGGLALIRRRR